MKILPQEIEVWYIIPAIRRDMSKILVDEHKLSYERTAEFLEITKAAVSQYINNKRAAKIRLHERALDEIRKSCKKLVDEKSDVASEITRILDFIRKNKLHCELCGKLIQGVLHDCNPIPYKPVLVKVKESR